MAGPWLTGPVETVTFTPPTLQVEGYLWGARIYEALPAEVKNAPFL